MYVRLIIFMDDVFIMVASKEEITLARDISVSISI